MKVVLANQPAHRGDTIFTFTILQTKKWRPWVADEEMEALGCRRLRRERPRGWLSLCSASESAPLITAARRSISPMITTCASCSSHKALT